MGTLNSGICVYSDIQVYKEVVVRLKSGDGLIPNREQEIDL